MAIADTIQSMYDNVGEVYDTITNVSLPNHKNIENIPSTIRDSYLEIMNNGIDVVWENWDKVTGSGTSITLNNTVEAPMKLVYKGNTSQETTTGKNLLAYTLQTLKSLNTTGTWNNNVYSLNGIIFTVNDDLSIKVNGTASTSTYLILTNNPDLTNGTEYKLNGCPSGGNIQTYSLRMYEGTSYISQTGSDYTFSYSNQGAIRINVFGNTTVNNLTFYPMIRLSSVSDNTYEKPTFGPSPNPNYPQDIHVVTGDNSIEVSNGTQSASYPINLGSIELCKIGDYQDYIYKENDKWYKYGAIGKVVFDGTETWGLLQETTNYGIYYYTQTDKQIGVSNLISDRFIVENSTSKNCISGRGNNQAIVIALDKSICAYVLATFKTWLSNNNTTVYYVLNNPTYTEITDSTLINQLEALKSKTGQTNITQTNDDMPFELDVTALGEM